MAANQAGLSVSDLLNDGLNANTTNQLLNSMVEYLAKLYQEAGDSKVIQQQIAQVYGMSAADLKAAVNLAKSNGIISRNGLTYGGAINRLYSMANSM
jgi:nitrate reductase beta subunit